MQLLGLNKLQPHEIKSYKHKIGVESDVSRSDRGQVAGRKMDPCSTVAYERRSRNATRCYPGGVLSVDSSRATRPVVTIWCCGCVLYSSCSASACPLSVKRYQIITMSAGARPLRSLTTCLQLRLEFDLTAIRPRYDRCDRAVALRVK